LCWLADCNASHAQGVSGPAHGQGCISKETMSSHFVHVPGVAQLKRWGLLDKVVASNCPPVCSFCVDKLPVNTGVLVDSMKRTAPAKRAGLEMGDMMIAFNDEPISNIADPHKRLVGEGIRVESSLTVIRHTAKLTLGITGIAAGCVGSSFVKSQMINHPYLNPL
jgi:hypothetical protein